jgi:hypothetical protein
MLPLFLIEASLILIGSVWCWSAKRNRRRELSRRSMQRHLERLEAAE